MKFHVTTIIEATPEKKRAFDRYARTGHAPDRPPGAGPRTLAVVSNDPDRRVRVKRPIPNFAYYYLIQGIKLNWPEDSPPGPYTATNEDKPRPVVQRYRWRPPRKNKGSS